MLGQKQTSKAADVVRSCLRYIKRQAIPRWFSLLAGSEFWISALLSASFGLWGRHTGLSTAKVGDVATAALAYAAVGFGFSLAGLTLALTLPDEQFARELATASRPTARSGVEAVVRRLQHDEDAYSSLLFVFSWTALAHWLTVVASFAFLIKYGFDQPLLPRGASAAHVAAVSAWAFVAIYAVAMFLLTLVTLSQVGQTYIANLRKRSR